MGRVIGDGGCYFKLVDVAVCPQHQKKGVGTLIMQALMDYIDETAPPKASVILLAHGETSEFFTRYGFKATRPLEQTWMHLRMR